MSIKTTNTLKIHVVTGAKIKRVIKEGDIYKIYVTAKPEKGKANESALLLLANHLGITRSRLKIKRGASSKKKIVELD